MTEQLNQGWPNQSIGLPTDHDYTRAEDVAGAINRLVAGLKEDGDEYRMFEYLGGALQQYPEVVMPIVQGSIELAEAKLGQDRRTGSSATLLYPIDAAMRVTAKRLQQQGGDPLSALSWDTQKVATVLHSYPAEVVDLAGSNTTSKNLPQRAAHILWLLDQCPLVAPGQSLSFLEVGASGGLILDALQQPARFKQWMAAKGYRSDFAEKSGPSQTNQVLGIDLVKPELDWLQAVILEDGLRLETTEFMQRFSRSAVALESATKLGSSALTKEFYDRSEGLPIIFSCFMFYQLDESTRRDVTEQARDLLRRQNGGLLIVSDIAKYRGFPDKAGGCVSWIENQDGQQVSPKILLARSTLTEWEEV